MTLEQIKMFVTIAETGSLGQAAKVLHRTQPTLSVSIKNLEGDLGVQIFSRKGYRMTLSQKGQALLEKAKKILRQSEEMEQLALHLVEQCEPEIRIAIDPIIPIHSVLGVLKQCESTFPLTKLTLISEYMQGGLESLLNDQVDLALIPIEQWDTRVEYIPFPSVPFIRVVAPQFLKLHKGSSITFKSLENHTQVVLQSNLNEKTKPNFSVLEGGKHWFVSEMQTKKEIILAGVGWGGLPVYLIEEELKRGELVPLNIKGSPTKIQIETGLARKTGMPFGKVANFIWDSGSVSR